MSLSRVPGIPLVIKITKHAGPQHDPGISIGIFTWQVNAVLRFLALNEEVPAIVVGLPECPLLTELFGVALFHNNHGSVVFALRRQAQIGHLICNHRILIQGPLAPLPLTRIDNRDDARFKLGNFIHAETDIFRNRRHGIVQVSGPVLFGLGAFINMVGPLENWFKSSFKIIQLYVVASADKKNVGPSDAADED